MTDWTPKTGDRALLPVVVAWVGPDGSAVVDAALNVGGGRSARDIAALPGELIADTRRPSWLPGQPGDVAEWGGRRWGMGGNWWHPIISEPGSPSIRDDEVPADAVLVLPAKTRP